MRGRSLVVGGMAGVIAMTMAGTSWGAGGVEGSVHDFSTNSVWNARKGVCSVCHTAHGTDDAQLVPLWAHATSENAGSFTLYESPTLNATDMGQPGGASLACLSCHDGSVAVNQGISGLITNSSDVAGQSAVMIDAAAQIGPDLHTTHPISFTYDAALAAADGGLENPMVYAIGNSKSNLTVTTAPVPTSWSGTSLSGKTIDQAMLIDHKMQCSSCHDVHRLEGSSPSSGILARLSGSDSTGRGSLLCRTCHIK